jgi:4-amino-4-deoxy-L-arabinose transferase-like glycosyltransferase
MITSLSLVRFARGRTKGARERAKTQDGPKGRRNLVVGIQQLVPFLIPFLLFLLAFGLRAWGTRFGLPEYFYHPDEHAIVDRATAILKTGDYNPHWFNYPSTYIYIQALTYIPYFLISAARGFGDRIPSFTPYGFYFAGRLMTALVGALTVLLVYVLGRRMFDRKTGLISSLLLTFSLLHAVHSHYVTADVPVAFLIILSFLFSYLAMDKGATKYYILAGLFAGLATSTKYPAFIAILPLLLVPLLTVPRGEWTPFGQRLGLIMGAFMAGFLLGTPYAFLDLDTFLSSLGAVLSHYSASQPGFEGSDAGVWYARQMLRSADVVMVSIGLGGILWAVYKHTRKDLLMLSFLVPYYVLLSLWRVRFERHLVALLPFLVILAARFLVEGVSWLSKRWPIVRRGEIPLLACLSVVAIFMPAKAIIDFDAALAQKDHRTIAAEWVNANIPAGSKVVSEAFAIPLDRNRFQVRQLVRIDSQDLAWYRKEGVEYIIVSDGHWRVLFGEPEKYAREIEIYNDIVNHSTVLQEFSKEVPPSLAQGYFTIPVYHFPDVLILKLR